MQGDAPLLRGRCVVAVFCQEQRERLRACTMTLN
jgi:hypothetical protein